jgi:hypothetical protein
MKKNDKTTEECRAACRQLGEYLTADMTGLNNQTLLTLIGEIDIKIDSSAKPIGIDLSDIDGEILISFSLNDLVKEHIGGTPRATNGADAKFYAKHLNGLAAQFESIAKKYRTAAKRV